MTVGVFNWQDLEAEAERIVAEVVGEINDFGSVPSPVTTYTQPDPLKPESRLPNWREWTMLSFAGTAATLAGTMWFSQLNQVWPGLIPLAEEPKDEVIPLTLAQREAQVLDEYKTQLQTIRTEVTKKNNVGPTDPFRSPFKAVVNHRGRVVSLQRPRIPVMATLSSPFTAQIAPPPTLQPATPVALQPLPPLPGIVPQSTSVASVPQGLPVPPVQTAPTLIGIVGEGDQRSGLFQQGDSFKELRMGDQMGGWVIKEIQSNQAVLKKGLQTRSVSLGGS